MTKSQSFFASATGSEPLRLSCARTLQLGRDNPEANQRIKPRWIGRAAFLSLHDQTGFGSFGRLWSTVWRGLLEPAACPSH